MVTWMENGICAPVGFQAAGIHCGIRRNRSKKDLALIYSSVMCTAASTYTLNKVKGAPIAVTKRHLQDGHAQAITAIPAMQIPATPMERKSQIACVSFAHRN